LVVKKVVFVEGREEWGLGPRLRGIEIGISGGRDGT
jgi:hypothetical protein